MRCFVTAAEELHVGRAAARLGIEQSAVSRAVKKLETEFGCELLVRRRGCCGELTEAGEAALAAGRELLEIYSALAQRLSEFGCA
jgi:DNA-binding transcriptional LysR family regulator